MKKILITGADSYIGTSFKRYMYQYDNYHIDTLDMLNHNWKNYDFGSYDTVFHVAGIAHQKETKENSDLYFKVNRDLAIDVAKKAKESKVRQFVFMSSMSVYGLDLSTNMINLNTPLKPTTSYGTSKLEAENQIFKLADSTFIVSTLRPPMVYGENCPGNLTKLFKLVKKIHVFPTIKNERSCISIERLCKSIKEIIDECTTKVYLPQDDVYMCTYETVKQQMNNENVKVIYINIFNPLIKLLIGKNKLVTKIFGDLKYEK